MNTSALEIQRNFIAHSPFFARYDLAISVTQTPDFVSSASGIKAGPLNVNIPVTDNPDDSQHHAMLGYFTDRQTPAVLWLWDHLTKWKAYLKAHDVTLMAVNTGMCAAPQDICPPPALPVNLDIQAVTCPHDVRDFGAVVSQAFGKSADAPFAQTYYARLADTGFYNDPRIRMFVGHHNGQPVCTGTVLLEDDVAGIYSIATTAAMRKQRLGSAIFQHIIAYAQQTYKPRLFTLKASPLGLNIYLKAGFKAVCEVYIYDNRNQIQRPHQR